MVKELTYHRYLSVVALIKPDEIVRETMQGRTQRLKKGGAGTQSRVGAAMRRAQRAEFFSRTYNAQRSRKVWGHAPI